VLPQPRLAGSRSGFETNSAGPSTCGPSSFSGRRARLQQRETAASLTQTSVRYLAFGLALVLSILVLSGVRNVDTIAGGAFVAIVLGFAVQRVLWDVLAGLFMFFESWFEVGDMISVEPWGLQGVVEEVSLRS
jgi:moderate conductance mechanosensitive channel